MNFNVLIVIFLLINLFVGIKFSYKVKNIKDYVLANKNYSTMAIVFTYIATLIGGGTIFGETMSKSCFLVFFSGLGVKIAFFLRAKFMVSKMERFKDCMTLSDMMGVLYGKEAKIFTGVLSFIKCCFSVILQLGAVSIICEKILNINPKLGIIFTGIVLAFYTIFGGIRSVTSTDILQCSMLFILIIILSNLVINKIGGIDIFLSKIPEIDLDFFSDPNFFKRLTFGLTCLIFSYEIINPAIMQRVLMASSKRQLKKVFIYVGSIDFLVSILLLIISLGAKIIFGNLPSSEVIYICIKELVPHELHFLMIAGIISIVISTADSYMHAGGVSFSLDILRKKEKEIFWAKIGTFLVSIIGIIFAIFKFNDFTNLIFRSMQIMAVTIIAPLFLGFLGIKGTKKSFWITCFSSCFFCLVSTLIVNQNYEPMVTLASIIFGCLVFILLNIFENKKILIEKFEKKENKSIFFSSIRKVFIEYFIKSKVKSSFSYKNFSLFVLFSNILPLFNYGKDIFFFSKEIIFLKLFSIILSTLILINQKWNSFFSKYLNFFYNFSITYCFIFLSTSLVFLTKFKSELVLSFILNLIFLSILINFKLFFLHLFFGISFSLIFFGSHFSFSDINFSQNYYFFYQLIFWLVIGFVFFKKNNEKILNFFARELFQRKLNKVLTLQLNDVKSYKEKIIGFIGNGHVNFLEKFDDIIFDIKNKNIEKFEQDIKNIKKYFENIVEKSTTFLKLKPEKIKISELEIEIKDFFGQSFFENIQIKNLSTFDFIFCDKVELFRILFYFFDLFKFKYLKHTNRNEKEIFIYFCDSKISYYEKDTVFLKTVDSINFIFSSSDYLNSDFFSKKFLKNIDENQNKLGISFENIDENSIINSIDAHYGIYEIKDLDELTIFFSIPINIYSIRPENLDLKLNDFKNLESIDKSLEEKFLQKLNKLYPSLKKDQINKSIMICKKYLNNSNQKDLSYFNMCCNIGIVFLNLCQEESSIKDYLEKNLETCLCSCFLYKILEKTSFTIDDMKIEFGEKIKEVVLQLTEINYTKNGKFLLKKDEIDNKNQNILSFCIKISEILSNLLYINSISFEVRRNSAYSALLFLDDIYSFKMKKFFFDLKKISIETIDDDFYFSDEYYYWLN